ncbi:MAG: oxidoreductase [Candidatus Aegiribacteria sp.]|nr:oxidoreductase [Candidatus Aegiribacteria sp.]MBD3295091.1 oxidoreductase [Candidatus Fermentibacteria bacterium]
MKNPYRSIETRVLDVITETPSIKTFVLEPQEELTFKPGQFMEFSVPGVGEAPFTPSSDSHDQDKMEITIVKVGKVTDAIHALKPGDTVGLRGPLGQGYPMTKFIGHDVVIVGGGVGLAPIRTLMYGLFHMRKQFSKLVYRGGCRNPREFLYRKQLEEWMQRDDIDMRLTVDEGDDSWNGPVGVVTTIMDDIDVDFSRARAIVCGPPIMMKFATFKLQELGVKDRNIYLSMEKNMSCGFGKCGHCRIGPYYCCKDGPVFTYDMIREYPGIWE